MSKELNAIERPNFIENYKQFSEGAGLILLFTHNENSSTLMVYFMKAEKAVSVAEINSIVQQMKDKQIYRTIIICNKTLSPQADRLIREIDMQSVYRIEFFMIYDLLVNVSRHELVPKHMIASEEEKSRVLKKYMVKTAQLPKMLHTDPMARYLGLKKGQMVKILRNSQTAGLHVVYRIVI